MSSPLKFNREMRPNFRFERSDYRAYYENLAFGTLLSIVRQKKLIASLMAIAVAIASMIMPLLPRRYSAEALVYPNLLSHEQGKVVPLASVDGATIVTGEARLIRSDAILREVAKRLGHDPGAPESRSWLTKSTDWFRTAWFPETRVYSAFDSAVAKLRNKVVITSDSRSYMISVSFTASTAEEAAQVVNTVVTEYLRDKVKQRWLNKVVSAETELRQQLALYGDKHPKTMQAVAELNAERASFEAATNSQAANQYEMANDQSVRLAVPNYTPTSPRGFAIFGLSILTALLAGIGLAIWRDRRDEKLKKTTGQQPHSQ